MAAHWHGELDDARRRALRQDHPAACACRSACRASPSRSATGRANSVLVSPSIRPEPSMPCDTARSMLCGALRCRTAAQCSAVGYDARAARCTCHAVPCTCRAVLRGGMICRCRAVLWGDELSGAVRCGAVRLSVLCGTVHCHAVQCHTMPCCACAAVPCVVWCWFGVTGGSWLLICATSIGRAVRPSRLPAWPLASPHRPAPTCAPMAGRAHIFLW